MAMDNGAAACTAKHSGRLDYLKIRCEQLSESLDDLEKGLGHIADRVLGSMPEEAQQAVLGGRPILGNRDGMLQTIADQLDALENKMSRLNKLKDRLAAL